MRITYTRRTRPPPGVRSWWGKAWQRAVEEAAFSDAELRPGRAHARRGDVGGISVDAGSLLAAVREGEDAWTVEVAVPVLEPAMRRALRCSPTWFAPRAPRVVPGKPAPR